MLYKLDGGLDHVLVDEAQDTAPDQWAILRALTDEFFSARGLRGPRPRTVFVVGDEKQSIYSFQGAAPERFLSETRPSTRRWRAGSASGSETPELLDSYRSTPEVLAFVDAVFSDDRALAGLRPGGLAGGRPIEHRARRDRGDGAVELWPLEKERGARGAGRLGRPLDLEPPEGAEQAAGPAHRRRDRPRRSRAATRCSTSRWTAARRWRPARRATS